MLLEKRLFESLQDLKDYCEDKGFIIDNNEMRWGYANQDSNCHWEFDDVNETMNFIDSDGNDAFPYSLCDLEVLFKLQVYPKGQVQVILQLAVI